MEVKEKSKKRELIKTIAIIFLAALLVLTFFSGTIMNYSLPEVATQMVSSGTINAKIRGSGAVSANESYNVELKQTREIRSVCVKVGDTVAEGDLLFVLGDMESTELQEAQNQLKELQMSRQRKVLELSKTYAAEDLSVKTLRETLEKAIAERDANYIEDSEVSAIKGAVAAKEADIRQSANIITELEALQKQSADSAEYKEASEAVTTLKEQVKTLEGTVETLEKSLNELNTTGDVDYNQKLREAQQAVNEAYTAWSNDYDANLTVYTELLGSVAGIAQMPDKGISVEAFMRQGSYIEAYLNGNEVDQDRKAEYQRVYSLLLGDQTAIDTANKALQQVQNDVNNNYSSISAKRRDIQNQLTEAEGSLSTARRQLAEAQQRLDAVTGVNDQVSENLRAYEAIKRQQDAELLELQATQKELEAKQTAYKAALDTVEETQKELESTLSGKDIDKQLNNLDLQSMDLEIARQQELVDKYRKDSVDAEVTAKVSGVITAVNAVPGKEADISKPLAVIDVVDRGYTVQISVTNDQAKQVRVGDTAEVTNYYWGNNIEAVLEQISADPASSGQKKLLTFRVSGDIDAGTNISLSIGQRSAPYDAIVPKSALREDTNGKFVLVVTSKNTPLGNRYTATRADVQVLAEDDTSVAVSGLAQNDYVITTSSKPLDSGSQVRMVENP